MKTWRVLVVDDEAPARRELRLLLGARSEIEIVGEAARAADAVRSAEQLQPDIIFLDIELPDDSGLEIAEQLPESAVLVFVTAYDEHPLRAFEVGAFDYLLKPVKPERLQRTLDRLRTREAERAPVAGTSAPLLLGTKGRTISAPAGQVAAVVATGHFTDVFLTDGRKISEWRSLREWETLLGAGFHRAHRRALVATRHVRELRVLPDGGALALVQGCGAPFRVSRRCVGGLRAAIADTARG